MCNLHRRCSDPCISGHLAELSIPYIQLLLGYFKGNITKLSLSGTILHVLVSAVHIFTLIYSQRIKKFSFLDHTYESGHSDSKAHEKYFVIYCSKN